MTSPEVRSLVLAEIAGRWDETNAHGVDLRSSLLAPERIEVIWRSVEQGSVRDEIRAVWLVLEENSVEQDGYKIVFDESRKMFGLASRGFPSDPFLCLVGYYGDFWATFASM